MDASLFAAKSASGGLQPSLPENSLIPILQECIDAITEHQRLQSLMKGEWGKGLLPQSSVRAEYTVQRIRGSLTLNCTLHVSHSRISIMF